MKRAINESLITDSASFKKLSMITESMSTWKNLTVEDRIDRAMEELGIDDNWRRAVAKGANHIPAARFAVMVQETKLRANNKPRYFIKAISKELAAK